MAEEIKVEIKRRADARRERQSALGTTAGTGDTNFIIETGEGSAVNIAMARQPPADTTSSDGTGSPQKSASKSPLEDPRLHWVSSELGFLDQYEENHDRFPLLSGGRDFEIDFLMKYLDYIFPLLFPFYQPRLHETGRSWVLALLRRNRVAFHSAMSLSAFFFTFTLINSYPGQHDYCKSQLWEKIGAQTNICFKMIQHDIQDLSLRGSQVTLSEKVRAMESITQYLIFEVALSGSADWTSHLTPALALFEDIWQTSNAERPESSLLAVLNAMTPPLHFGGSQGGFVWTPEQAGFRFFTGLLVFIDIIAGTSLERSSRLADYHPHLLADVDDGLPQFGITPVQLSSLIGAQNWVLLAISQINELDAWKKEMKEASSPSMVDVVERESRISSMLAEGIARLNEAIPSPQEDNPLSLHSYTSPHFTPSSNSSTTATIIWAHAASIYLAVVVSGWQPAETRSSVDQVLELLRTVDPTHMRTLAWPICVGGCLAEAGAQEQALRDLFTGMDELSMVGALGEARKIIEKVWESRETLEQETWDLASCFRILGAPVLLV